MPTIIFFEDDRDFPYAVDLAQWDGSTCPRPGETRTVLIRGTLSQRFSASPSGIRRFAWPGPLSDFRIVECWIETAEQAAENSLRLTARVLRVRQLADFVTSFGKNQFLHDTLYSPRFSDPCVWRLEHAQGDLIEYGWQSMNNATAASHESHWHEEGTIILFTDSDGIQHQVATTCVWDDWICVGDRALSPEALRKVLTGNERGRWRSFLEPGKEPKEAAL